MFWRRIIPVALVGLSVGIGSVSAASPPHTYDNAAHGYRLTYPDDWSRLTLGRPADAGFLATDQNAAVVVIAVPADTAGDHILKQFIPHFVTALGTVEGHPTMHTRILAGVRAQVALISYRSSQGLHGGAILILLTHHNRRYILAGAVNDLQSASATQDTNEVAAICQSLTFH